MQKWPLLGVGVIELESVGAGAGEEGDVVEGGRLRWAAPDVEEGGPAVGADVVEGGFAGEEEAGDL